MNAQQTFIAALRKDAKHIIGSTSIHASGVAYHYEKYVLRDAPYFMQKLWEAAAYEIHGNYQGFAELTIDGVVYRYTSNPMKTGPRDRCFGCSILVKHH